MAFMKKSITNAKKPNQVAKANRKASGSTRTERKAAVKSVARGAARNTLGHELAAKKGAGFASAAGQSSYRAARAAVGAMDKAAAIGVKPKKIDKAYNKGQKAVYKRIAKAAKVQGTNKK